MSKIQDIAENFGKDMERFCTLCQVCQAGGGWDSETNGDMEDYYIQSLMSTMLRIIASDGVISRKEAELFNECFGTDNSVEEFEKMYDDSEDILVGEEYEKQLREDYDMLKGISQETADSYRELWLTACEILIASDGQLLPEEIEDAKRLKQVFQDE